LGIRWARWCGCTAAAPTIERAAAQGSDRPRMGQSPAEIAADIAVEIADVNPGESAAEIGHLITRTRSRRTLDSA